MPVLPDGPPPAGATAGSSASATGSGKGGGGTGDDGNGPGDLESSPGAFFSNRLYRTNRAVLAASDAAAPGAPKSPRALAQTTGLGATFRAASTAVAKGVVSPTDEGVLCLCLCSASAGEEVEAPSVRKTPIHVEAAAPTAQPAGGVASTDNAA